MGQQRLAMEETDTYFHRIDEIGIVIGIIEHIPCARHCAKGFACITSLNLYQIQALLLTFFK